MSEPLATSPDPTDAERARELESPLFPPDIPPPVLEEMTDREIALHVLARVGRIERVVVHFHLSTEHRNELLNSVRRLGANTIALQEALQGVDSNQRALMSVQREINEVRRDTASRSEIATYRRIIVDRLLGFSVLAVLLLALGGIGLVAFERAQQERVYQTCTEGNRSRQLFADYFRSRAGQDPAAARIAEQFEPTNCGILRK